MPQSLISLKDDEIQAVLAAVTAFCDERGDSVDSAMGRQAMTIAVSIVTGNRTIVDLLPELRLLLSNQEKESHPTQEASD
ncbi:hypothetical protein [Rhizobium sp. HT1-10]|uniref:hypothetical protein n=1 Tax=Rhizobium sp. HT1-10 TaxID=3111638 RepID=UPI003C18413F